MAAFQFQRASREKRKARIAVSGAAKSGKTRFAVELASKLASSPEKVLIIDTENRSAALLAGERSLLTGKSLDFFTFEFGPPFSPERYVEALQAAAEAGFEAVVIDSATHEWDGSGGVLSIVDEETAKARSNNSQIGWKNATPRHNKFLDAIVRAPFHIIAAVRAKQDYVQERDERTGKIAIKKVGMAPIQRPGFEYEFDIFCELDQKHQLFITDSRCSSIDGKVYQGGINGEFVEALTSWLDAGIILVSQRDIDRLKEAIGRSDKSSDEVIQYAATKYGSRPSQLELKKFEELLEWVATPKTTTQETA